ncbi:MAG: hypothetical protein ACOC0J_02560 [Myxococcota bacterium]
MPIKLLPSEPGTRPAPQVILALFLPGAKLRVAAGTGEVGVDV